ncbi:MAG: ribonuclease P protein component [Anaerovoracaceae bacterium]|jgi:ribonuclease P protein component
MLKPNVLRNDKDFKTIYKKGKSVGERYVVLFYKRNGLPYNRTAFLASKKVGNSVVRNRARRLLKESYRELEESLKTGYDIIIIARNTIVGLKCGDVKKSLESAFKKSKLINQKSKQAEAD